MGKGNRKFNEEKEFSDIMSFDNNTDLSTVKTVLGDIIPKNLSVRAKNDKQKDLINSIRNNQITICAGPPGTGKAQPLDSLVLSKDGFKKMGDISIGEDVFTKNGVLTKVSGIYPQGVKDVYKVTFSDNSVTECCGEHLWYCKTVDDRRKKKEFKVKSLNEIRKNYINSDNKKNYSIPITKPINFEKKDIKINPYIMGFLIGDGCFVAPNIRLTTNDDDVIKYFNDNLNENYKISKIRSSKYDYSIRIVDGKNDVSYNKLIEYYGLKNIKSDNKFIPNDYKFNSIENRIELLQGLMDSDGTVDYRNGSLSFSTSSKKLINDFKFLIESLGGHVNNLIVKKGKYKKNDIITECKNSYIYSFRIPNEIPPFKLKRKLDRVKYKTKYLPSRFIKNIEFVGKKETQCISVEDESQSYLTDSFIVTHNTFVSVAYALTLLRKAGTDFKKIYLIKSVTTLKGEELGFLKGDMKDKIEPFMWSFMINMEKLISTSSINALMEKDIIRPFPLAYMRGASLDNCIIIADEMQNISLDNSRTLMTRIGSNCKLIVLGDTNQIDMRNKEESSLQKLLDIFENVDEIGVINMGMEDTNVRNPLITTIEEKYKNYYDSKEKK